MSRNNRKYPNIGYHFIINKICKVLYNIVTNQSSIFISKGGGNVIRLSINMVRPDKNEIVNNFPMLSSGVILYYVCKYRHFQRKYNTKHLIATSSLIKKSQHKIINWFNHRCSIFGLIFNKCIIDLKHEEFASLADSATPFCFSFFPIV